MYKFAQATPSIPVNFASSLCADYNDQSTGLANVWVALVVSTLVFFIFFGLIKRQKIGVAFLGYFLSLGFARLLFSSDECSHGGLFTSEGLVILLPISILTASTLVYGIYQSVIAMRTN